MSRAGTHVALRVLGLAVLFCTFTSETLALPDTMPELTGLGVIGRDLIIASQALSFPLLAFGRQWRWSAHVLLTMLTVGLVLVALPGDGHAQLGMLVPGYWAGPMLVLAMVSLPRTRYLRFAAVSAVVLVLAMTPTVTYPNDWRYADWLYIVQPIAEVALFGDAMVVIAKTRDRSLARRIAAEQRHDEVEHESRERREAARMLHDHVLHALHALGSGATGGVAASMAIEECREAHAAMTLRPPSTSVVRLETLLDTDPAMAQSGAVLFGHSRPIPRAVAEAMAAATHEALNNVIRHADASTVQVQIQHHRSTLEVSIDDDGDGFDIKRRPSGRLGVSQSILARMNDVGGVGSIDSIPGRGTTVTLRWPRGLHEEVTDAWDEAPEQTVRRRLTLTVWPSLVTGLAVLPSVGGLIHHHWPVMAFCLVTLLFGAALAIRAQRVRLGGQAMIALAVAAVAGWLVNLLAVPEVPSNEYALWMAWGASSLIHLMVLSRSPRLGSWIFGGWAVLQLGTLWWRYPDPEAMYWLSSLYAGGAGEVGITVIVMAVARRMAAQEAQATIATSQARAATARLQRLSQLDHHWSERVTREALPLIKQIGDGTLAPDAPGVCEQAMALETALRDELVLGPEHGDLLAELAACRQAGWRVTSMLTSDDTEMALENGQKLLAILGAPSHVGQVVTLSTNKQRTTLVVLDADESQPDRWSPAMDALEGTMVVAPDFVRLALSHVTAPATPPLGDLVLGQVN